MRHFPRIGELPGKTKPRCIHTGMNTPSMPRVFSRYTQEKYNAFKTWLATKHGQTIYTLFRQFSETYRNAGHARCGASLIGNRIRWEISVGEYLGFKVSNDFLPMLASQIVLDRRDYGDFSTLHDTATKRALEAAAVGDSDMNIHWVASAIELIAKNLH